MEALTFKKLAILSDGNHVKGGYLQYSFDSDGHIAYQGQLETTMVSLPLTGESAVKPDVLQSKNMVAGLKFDFGNLTVEITQVKDGIANASVELSGSISAKGWAKFDLSADVIALKELEVSGQYPVAFFSIAFVVHAVALHI